jgi:hypothetical protein
MKHFLREPLVHFLLLGAILFGAYAHAERDHAGVEQPKQNRLTIDDLSQLVLVFQAQWQRDPTPEELQRLVEDSVREEVLSREALALGLDKNDTIVKRRMAQKMQFLAEDVAAAREPTTEELATWYEANRDQFAFPPRVSFRHLYFSPDRRGGRARDDAAAALTKLTGQPAASNLAATLADAFNPKSITCSPSSNRGWQPPDQDSLPRRPEINFSQGAERKALISRYIAAIPFSGETGPDRRLTAVHKYGSNREHRGHGAPAVRAIARRPGWPQRGFLLDRPASLSFLKKCRCSADLTCTERTLRRHGTGKGRSSRR